MKNTRSIIIVSVLLQIIFGQTQFTVTPEMTSAHIALNRTLIIDSPIHNISSESLTLVMVRTQNNLPEGWLSAMCIGVCFPADLDTLITNAEYFMNPLSPDEEREFSLDVFADGDGAENGTAYIQLFFYDLNMPSDSIRFDFVISSLTSPPTAFAGEDQTITEGETVYLDGSLSEDPDGDELTFYWTSNYDVTFDDPNSETPTFTAPWVDEITEIECTLTISDGVFTLTDNVTITVESTVANEPTEVVQSFELFPAYPNPFNPVTTISYSLNLVSSVDIIITNIQGEQVYQLSKYSQPPGRHSIQWNGRNNEGNQLSSGVYICNVRVGNTTQIRSLVLTK